MNITIRNAKLEDAPMLGHIQVMSWRSAFRNIASDEYLDRRVSEKNQAGDWQEILAVPEQVVFVAAKENQLIGYAWAHKEEENPFHGIRSLSLCISCQITNARA